MIYFKAVGGRGVDNVKPVHRSPSVSVLCYCVLSLILINQMQRAVPQGGASGGVRNVPSGNVRGASHVSVILIVFIVYLILGWCGFRKRRYAILSCEYPPINLCRCCWNCSAFCY